MADITRTPASVGILFPQNAEIFDFVSAEALTAGQPVFMDATTGKVKYSDANDSARDELLGIALKSVGANQPVGVLRKGHVAGFTLAGNYGTYVYVSNTAGELADASGTALLPVGQVVCVPDETPSKVLFVDIPWRYVDLVDDVV